ncbi:hypothetical protein [Wandonia haliotis]
MEKIKATIESTIKERMKSPFYGTFIISWIICNWKIFVVLFFVSSKDLESNKLDFISNKLISPLYGFTYPLGATILLILIIPWINEVAFKIKLFFEERMRSHEHKASMKNFFKHHFHKLFDKVAYITTRSVDVDTVFQNNSELNENVINFYIAYGLIEIKSSLPYLTEKGKIFLTEYYENYHSEKENTYNMY